MKYPKRFGSDLSGAHLSCATRRQVSSHTGSNTSGNPSHGLLCGLGHMARTVSPDVILRLMSRYTVYARPLPRRDGSHPAPRSEKPQSERRLPAAADHFSFVPYLRRFVSRYRQTPVFSQGWPMYDTWSTPARTVSRPSGATAHHRPSASFRVHQNPSEPHTALHRNITAKSDIATLPVYETHVGGADNRGDVTSVRIVLREACDLRRDAKEIVSL